ncbi:MAG TPA: arylsulfotransferase family protein, partial [Acidimicrobiales bacterium]|nr:arylsulfotransferase family protein [Acidimicrobiales bacterium]
MDNNGVPVFVNRRTVASFDFKPQPNGRYSFLERSDQESSLGRDIFDAVILNSAMQEIRRVRNRPPIEHTDNHEVILLPGGGRLLMAYEPFNDNGTMREATMVQEVNAAGEVVLNWSSWPDVPLSDNLSGNLVDYSHGNSIDIMNDGNLLISLRGTSSVVKVNRQTGDLMWTLGGKSSDFDIDDPLGSFCGQHTAYELPNGNILMFDNAVDCPPNGADRSESRAVEYAIDEQAMTAEVAWSHSQGIFGFATGSTQRLANGNTLIAWGTSGALSEVNADGDILWETTPRTPAGAVSATYRIHRAPFPDAIRPRVAMSSPANGATFLQGQQVRARYFCADEGGSSIASCEGTVTNGHLLDTSTPGPHTVEVVGTDGSGNTRTLERTYQVVADQPDVAVRNGTSGRLVGNDVYNRSGEGQTRHANVPRNGTAIFTAVVENDGVDTDTFLIHGSDHDADFTVRYFNGARDVTAAVKDGSFRFRDLAPGARRELQVQIGARPGSTTADAITVFLQARSTTNPSRRDTGRFIVNRSGAEATTTEYLEE